MAIEETTIEEATPSYGDIYKALSDCTASLNSAEETVVKAAEEITGVPKLVEEAKEIVAGVRTDVDAHTEAIATAQADISANAAEIASVKSQTETVVNEMGTAIGELSQGMVAIANGAATKAEVEAVQATADNTKAAVDNETTGLAATKAIADSAKTTAEAALPKAGGEMTGFFKYVSNIIDVTQNPETNQYFRNYWGDKNKVDIGAVGMIQRPSGSVETCLLAMNRKDDGTEVLSTIYTVALRDGTNYATCSHPRPDNYGNDIVTTKYAKDTFPLKVNSAKIWHLGGENASDTTDLLAGRGESVNMPFASLHGILAFLRSHTGGGLCAIQLHGDVEYEDSNGQLLGNAGVFFINHDGTPRTIHFKSPFQIQSGVISFGNGLILHADNISNFLISNGTISPAQINLQACVLTGTVSNGSILYANQFGSITVSLDISGDIAGKKYSAENGGRILARGGKDNLPGTQNGLCDANSYVF